MDTGLHKGLILRLAKYLRVLRQLKSLGFVKVFSNNLGDAIGVTPAVVRKDFSQISIPGNKRGGYNIDVLIEEITTVLGGRATFPVVIVGCGRLGSALLNYREFDKEGIRVAAGFDKDAGKIDRDGRPPVLPIEDLPEFVRTHEIEVGIIAVPDESASEVFDLMIGAGVRGFLNFTTVQLKCGGRCDPENCVNRCVVENVNFGLQIENLFYLITFQKPENRVLSLEELKEKHQRRRYGTA
ncbi:MAG: redox-sensing transcriptional repressor Rex [Spirochaetaceae bacterium]